MKYTSEPQKMERRILLLGDTWDGTRDGIGAVNRSLARELARFAATRIYTTVLGEDSGAKSGGYELKNLEIIPSISGSLKKLCSLLDTDPDAVFPNLTSRVPSLSFIIGHSPITAKAALYFRDRYYQRAKVILFYHVIPRDLQYPEEELMKALPYPVPEDNELVRLAERADVVYSVTSRCHWYFTAKFRNRAKERIDHRRYVPICSPATFNVQRRPAPKKSEADRTPLKILALFDGCDISAWHGVDIAVCTVNKIATEFKKEGKPMPMLKVANIPKQAIAKLKEDIMNDVQLLSGVHIEISSYSDPEERRRDLAEFDLCLIPNRGDGYGCVGLAALSAGIPTLISKDSGTASIIARLTSEPEFFTVPVTPLRMSYRQDASVWRDHILELLENREAAQERSFNIRTALKRDEPSKESHDNVVTFCLGGIQVLHEVTEIAMNSDELDKELFIIREFNKFLAAMMKQCWRLKHHPLTSEDDLFEIVPGVALPIKELQDSVTEMIEEKDRRIVGVDDKTGAFYVYCPTPQTLRDLWSDCDKINKLLMSIVFRHKAEYDPLKMYDIHYAKVRTLIKGPEFLKYKEEVMKNALP